MKAGDTVAERFEIERLAAEGGMGAVYRAHDRVADRMAAVKVVRAADASSVERFVREALVLAELRHPGIVQYLAHGRTAGGELYLAMEWLDGEDLASRLAARELTAGESLRLLTHTAAALAVAHARGIVHRDLKPSNLFLVDYSVDAVKIVDFGIARLARLGELTAPGAVIGTPQYMAPEHARGERVDARADVYSLGVVLYRCLTGAPPFSGRSPAELLARVMNDDAPRVRARVPSVAPAVEDLVARMLARDPARRPADAAAILAEVLALDLTPAAGGSPTPQSPVELTRAERRVGCVLVTPAAGDAVFAAHGGTAERRDDLTVVVLHGGGTASDQAKQAARCALALPAGTPVALVMCRLDGQTPERDAVERARRMVAAGGIRVDEMTAGLLDARFVVAGDAHGLGLLGERAGDDDARTLLGRATPFVGRERELAALEGIFAACVQDGAARAVLVTAAPGLGKSRLRQELIVRLRRGPVEIWLARGDPMRAGAPFGLLGEAVRRAAGINGGEPLPARQEALLARVARHLPADRAAGVAEFLGELAGAPFEDSPQLRAARRDPLLLSDRVRAAWIEWLAAECRACPVVLILEDLHWGDAPTVKLVDAALAALPEVPFLVLGLARPEVYDRFPRIWAERGLEAQHLGELSRRAAERLVRQVLGESAGAATVARVVERAAGNAFYLEELIRQVAAGGPETLPDTVLAMVEARLQTLPAEARRVLRAASVYGDAFWTGAAQALVAGTRPQGEVGYWLVEMCEREILRRREASRFPGEQEYAFRHGLLRDAAYATLTEPDRALGHRLAAHWLAAQGEREALVLAAHFERAGDRPDAATWYVRAAEQALAANDLPATIERARKGAASGAAGAELGRLSILEAEAQRWLGDNAQAELRGREAMALLDRGTPPWFAAAGEAVAASAKLGHLDALDALIESLRAAGGAEMTATQAIAWARAATQCALCGRVETAAALLRELERAAPRLADDPGALAWISDATAYHAMATEAYEAATAAHLRAVEWFERAGDLRNACVERINAADSLSTFGAPEAAEALLREAIPAADGMGLAGAAKLARAYLAFSLTDQERLDEADAVAQAALALPTAAQPRLTNMAFAALGVVRHRQGRLAEAVEHLRLAVGSGVMSGPPLALLARALFDHGEVAEAARVVAAALAHPDQLYNLKAGAYLVHAEALDHLGDRPGARAALAEARRILDATLARLSDPTWRRRHVERVRDHRRILELAAAWGV